MSEVASTHNTATPTIHLELSGGIIDSNILSSVIDQLSPKAKNHLAYLNIYQKDSSTLKLLVQELNAGFKSLQILTLFRNDVGDDGVFSRHSYFSLKLHMDTQTAVAILRELKNFNQVKEVKVEDSHGIMVSEDTATELKKAFEHHKIQCRITVIDKQSYTNTTVECHQGISDISICIGEM